MTTTVLSAAELTTIIADLKAQVKAREAELKALNDVPPFNVGDEVRGTYGRAEKAREVQGNVAAIKGNQVLVLSGFDTFKFYASQLVAVNAEQVADPLVAAATGAEDSQTQTESQPANAEPSPASEAQSGAVSEATETKPVVKASDISNLSAEDLADLLANAS